MTISYQVPDLVDAIRRDGLPRVVTAWEQSDVTGQPKSTGVLVPVVMALEGNLVRSVPVSEWPGEVPANPTAEQIADALAKKAAEAEAEQTDLATVAEQVRKAVASLNGRSVAGAFTAAEIRTLLMFVLHELRHVDRSGNLRLP